MPKSKKEFIGLLSKKTGKSAKETAIRIDALTETLIDIFKTGEGVTIDGFGGFHVSPGYSGTRKFKFNPSQKIRYLMGWGSTFKGEV